MVETGGHAGIGADAAAALLPGPVVAVLRHRHTEPHRVHNTWASVGERLALAEDVLNGIADKRAFILGILFRTAVCDPRRSDNAKASAALMREMLAGSIPPPRLDRAAALIEAAESAEPPETADPSLRGDAALFADIDAAILGAEAARYDAYETGLRQESSHMREDTWRAGRSAALQMLLWRDRLYRTDRFFLDYERQARRNIARTIERLRR